MLATVIFYAPLVLYFAVMCALIFAELSRKKRNTQKNKTECDAVRNSTTSVPQYTNIMNSEAVSEISEETPSSSDTQQLECEENDGKKCQ